MTGSQPASNVDRTSGAGFDHLEPIAHQPTARVIAHRLRAAIVDGRLSPGTQMIETRLAEQLGVSRSPVREALQRLIQEGLAEHRRRGVFVRQLTDADVTDVYFARTACEVAAADAIMSAPHNVDWEVLEEALRSLEQAVMSSDHQLTVRADRRFHEKLVEAAGSPRLTKMFATLLAETAICLRQLEGEYKESSYLPAEHARILAALRSGDRAQTLRAINAHMEDALHRLTSGVDTPPA